MRLTVTLWREPEGASGAARETHLTMIFLFTELFSVKREYRFT